MYSMKAFTTSAIPLNCESGRDLPKRVTLGGDIFPMSNLCSASVEGDPLLPFLFKLMFSSALRDEIGVFKPVSLLFMVRRALEGLCDMTLVLTAFPLFFSCNCEKHSRHKVGLGVAHFNESVHTVQVKVLWVTVLLIREDFLHGQENVRNGAFEFEMVSLIVMFSQNFILLVTRGTEGQKIYHQNNKIYRIKPKGVSEWQSNFYRKKIYDTFG